MKKVITILVLFLAMFSVESVESQNLTSEIIEKYVKFISLEEKSVMYEVTIEYDSGSKTFVRLGNKITSYDVNVPELGIALNSPEIKGLRLEQGTVWIGSWRTNYKDVNSIDIHRETWYDKNGDIISQNIISESPTVSEVLIDVDIDDDDKEFIDSMVKFIKAKNN